MLLIMIDTEIILYKRKLSQARTRTVTNKVFYAIGNLEWLRNIISTTHRSGFNDLLYY